MGHVEWMHMSVEALSEEVSLDVNPKNRLTSACSSNKGWTSGTPVCLLSMTIMVSTKCGGSSAAPHNSESGSRSLYLK